MFRLAKDVLPFAALVALAVVGCAQESAQPKRHANAQAVQSTKPRPADSAEKPVSGGRAYVPAIEPKGCPKHAVVVMSWNGGNLGKKKSPQAIAAMVDVARESDIVLFQEVSTSEFGAQAVANIQDGLSRTGAAWDFLTSEPTMPKTRETEAHGTLWKPSKAQIDRDASSLVNELQAAISREPFRTVFSIGNKRVATYSFHAVPEGKGPEKEIRALTGSKELARAEYAIVAGDFNLSAKKAAPFFRAIGFENAAFGRTSLKNAPDGKGNYRHKDFDHVYVKGLTVCDSGVVDFPARHFAPIDSPEAMKRAKTVSDHLPVWVAIHWKTNGEIQKCGDSFMLIHKD